MSPLYITRQVGGAKTVVALGPEEPVAQIGLPPLLAECGRYLGAWTPH